MSFKALLRICSLATLLLLLFDLTSQAQFTSPYQPIIKEIGELEDARDPKCHATASRLEDFVFGTPLSFEARNQRIEFQKEFVEKVWKDFTGLKNDATDVLNDAGLFQEVIKDYLSYRENSKGVEVSLASGSNTWIAARDLRQYGTVAYGLRAILSVQQSYFSKEEKLAHLDSEVIKEFKKSIDLAVLSVLKEADRMARNENTEDVTKQQFDNAANALFPQLAAGVNEFNEQNE